MLSERALEYFEIIAESGITKHGGSVQATRELVQMCHIDAGKYVLDVGCGVGATPSYLAKELGCRVMGVDLLDKMVEQARRRAKSEGVQDRTEFRVADARELPFEDDLFDAVITESVNIFFEDKEPAMRDSAAIWDKWTAPVGGKTQGKGQGWWRHTSGDGLKVRFSQIWVCRGAANAVQGAANTCHSTDISL
jgi:SAM-dependent methyltransferase